MSSKITVIGTGMMGGAIIKSLLKGKIAPATITAVDIQADKLKEFEALGVKPAQTTSKPLQAQT